ncbi:MAG: type II CRISPR RNA-guided endonuclease Cas9 [Segatella oris]|uniref:type II CRISPR RNA-guided endonuclease Cas9 n=1 Tax=Segatella oris TaxID=28135 RepID=UPI003FA279EC
MKRILGLDLGTTSIGWGLVNEGESVEEESGIIKLGVRNNPLSVDEKSNFEKGKAITTNAERTLKHGMRINLQRYKQRRDNLVACLKEHGIINDDTPLFELGNNTTFQTYRSRAKAVSEEISLEDFARVLLMINKKRGYKSNRKAKDAEEGELIDGMDVAKELYNKNLTPGQYLMMLKESGKSYRPAFYRSDLQNELNRIWDKQKEFHPEILTDEMRKEINGLSYAQCSAAFYNKKNITTAKNSGKDSYSTKLKWRNDCLKKEMDIEQVAYVVCSLCGEINGSSQRLAMISDRSKELYFSGKTIGQYLMALLDENPNTSLTNRIFYRQDYIDEFNAIWECQARYHKELTPELRRKIADNIIFFQRDLKSCKCLISYCEFEHSEKEVDVEEKKKKVTVGLHVCPRSSPLFQTFKIWQVLNNIQVSVVGKKRKAAPKDSSLYLFSEREMGATQRFLEQDEKELLFKELSIKSKLKNTEILKMLFDNPERYEINYNEVEGNCTMSAFYSACAEIISQTGNGEYDFNKMRADDVKSLVEEIFTGLGYNTEFLSFNPLLEGKEFQQQASYRLWHLLYSYTGDKSVTGNDALLKRIGELCGMEREYARILANVSFVDHYGRLSAKAIRKILPHVMVGKNYDEACKDAKYIRTKESSDHLEMIKRNSLRNPVVEKILNQMVNVVNSLIDTDGKPDEIRIELARELKHSSKKRAKLYQDIRKATAEQENIKKILETEFGIKNVTKNDILRYRLYEELKMNGYKTLYSNTDIPREDLFTNKFDIEHIIPRAKLFDNFFSNKTLEARDVNIEKSNKTAYDFVAEKYGENGLADYETRVEELLKQKVISKTKRNKLLMREADIPKDFLKRDLNDSQYIAKKAREMLESIVPKVTTTTGAITKRLREDWKLVDVMKELNWDKYNRLGLTEVVYSHDNKPIKRIKDWTKRNDNRHHAMDALTIAFTRPAIIQYLNNMNARSDKGGVIYGIEKKYMRRDEHGKLLFKPPIPIEKFREEAKRQLEAILVSTQAKNKVFTKNINIIKTRNGEKKKVQLTPRDKLHNETIYGKIEQYHTEVKKVGGKFTEEVVLRVANKRIREALYARLAEFDYDPKKAFTGKNSLEKKPVWIDEKRLCCVPEEVKLVAMTQVFTIRKLVDKNLNIDKVIDARVREILKQRLEEYGDDAAKAFSNLEENPIWFNKEKGIAIKRVKISGKSNCTAIREKHDVSGQVILDETGKALENYK